MVSPFSNLVLVARFIKKFFREHYYQVTITKREDGCRELNARARLARVTDRLRTHVQALVLVECVYGQSSVNSQSKAKLIQSREGQTKLWEIDKVQRPGNKVVFSWWN